MMRFNIILFLLFFPQIIVANSSTSDQVDKAIQIVREKFQAAAKLGDENSSNNDYHQLQYTLASLLEFKAKNDDAAAVDEIASLYHKAAAGLRGEKKIESLLKGASWYQQAGDGRAAAECSRTAVHFLIQEEGAAFDPDVINAVLQSAAPILLKHEQPSSLQNLAASLVSCFPFLPAAHQLQGAVCRLEGDASKAFESYKAASSLPHKDDSVLLESLILASSAARHANVSVDTQLSFLETAAGLEVTDPVQLAELYNMQGVVHKQAGNREEAIRSFQKAVEHNLDDSHAAVQLASLDVEVDVTSMDANYVSSLFDGYSSRFEKELVETLDYKGHFMVAEALQEFWGPVFSSKDYQRPIVVDIGCGTGLLGQLIKELYSSVSLLGVDLSARMVDNARSKTIGGGDGATSVYSNVIQQDATSFLRELPESSVQAIVASDVLIYIGDVNEVFHYSNRALSKDGILVFTVEVAPAGMKLQNSGRFGHSKSYIRETAKKQGFVAIHWKESVLRINRGTAVMGAAVVLRRRKTD